MVTQTVISTATLSPSDSKPTSTSHTGAVVGGVVGGIAGAAILAALIFFLFRRRRQRDDFDGNFDPDRVVGLGDNRGTLPDIDLAADNVTPYTYHAQGQGQGVGPQHPTGPGGGAPNMTQYGGQVPAFLAGGLAGGAAGATMAHGGQGGGREGAASPPSAYSHSQPTQSNYAHSASDHGGYPEYAAYAAYTNNAQSAQGHSLHSSPTNTSFGPQLAAVPGRDFRHPSPGPSLAHTSYTGQTDPSVSGSSNGPGVIPSAKEREAMAYRTGNLSLANPDTANAGTSGGVMQHQDGGRLDATPEDEEPSEVPPRYDTIPHDR